MNKFETFDLTVKDMKVKNPSWFSHPDDLDLENEKIASDAEIESVEKILKVKFPQEYKYFLSKYPAGDFAYSIIYSVKSDSYYNIIKMNQRFPHIEYISFSDNGCGDEYGFKVDNRQCLSEVYFHDHENDQWERTEFKDFLEFLYDDAFDII